MDIRAQQAVGLAVDRPARHIHEEDRVVAGEERALLAERLGPDHRDIHLAARQRVRKRRALDAARAVDDEHLSAAVDEGHRGGAVVLEHAVLRRVGGLEHRLEAPRAGAFERERHRDGARACLEIDRKALAGRARVEVDGAAAVAQVDGALRGALATEQEAQVGGLARSRAGRRAERLEDDLVRGLVLDRDHIDGDAVRARDLGLGERVADILVAVGDEHDAVRGVGREDRERLADARRDVARVAVARVLGVGNDRARVGLRDDLGLAPDGDGSDAVLLLLLALDELLREVARRREERDRNRAAAVEDEGRGERLAAPHERWLCERRDQREDDERTEDEARPPLPALLAAAAAPREHQHRDEQREKEQEERAFKLHGSIQSAIGNPK